MTYVEFFLFFFFKQKTAYEVRISDWSSDVCSSDLLQRRAIEDRHLADVRARKREEHRARRAARADDCDSSTFEIEFGERGIKARGVGVGPEQRSIGLTHHGVHRADRAADVEIGRAHV